MYMFFCFLDEYHHVIYVRYESKICLKPIRLCRYIMVLRESGVLCDNITEFGVEEVICLHTKRSDIAIQFTRRRLCCLYILLCNGFMSLQCRFLFMLLFIHFDMFFVLIHVL